MGPEDRSQFLKGVMVERLALASRGIGWEESGRMSVPRRRALMELLVEMQEQEMSEPGQPTKLPSGVVGIARVR